MQQQVRSMVGCLKYIGEKKWNLTKFRKYVNLKKRSNCAPPAPGVKLNQYGLDPTKTLSRGQLQAATDARNTARHAGLPKEEVEAAAQRAVADFKKKECQQANSPSSPSTGNPTKENPDAMHQLSAADVKRETKLKDKPSILCILLYWHGHSNMYMNKRLRP